MNKFFTYAGMALLLGWMPPVFSEVMPPVAPPSTTSEAAVAPPGDLPATLSSRRYAPLSKKSPFTLASSVGENADFAKDLVLAGYFRIDGQDFVMVADKTKSDRIMVGSRPSPSSKEMILQKVERDPGGDPTKLKALIRKGGETATLTYGVGAPAASPPPVPGQPVAVPAGVPVPGQPAISQVPGQPGAVKPAVIRRRTIPIPTAPGR